MSRALSSRVITALAVLCAFAGGQAAAQGAPAAMAPPAQPPAASGDWASPSGSAVQARGATSPAEALFVEKCSMCHRQMGMGTVILARRVDPAKAMLEQRDDLQPLLIRLAVRTGLGNMPRITRGEVSDEQLEVIITHLTKGRR